MNVTFTSKGTTSMRSTSNKDNAFSGNNGNNYNNGKPQFGGCAVVLALVVVAVVIFTVVIPALGGFNF